MSNIGINITEIIKDVVKDLTSKKITFSIYDIENILHQKEKKIIKFTNHTSLLTFHELFHNKKFPIDYKRILMSFIFPFGQRRRLWVYYHKDNNPFDYNLEGKKGKNIHNFTKDNRIQVPVNLIKQIGAKPGENLWVMTKIKEVENISLSLVPEISYENPGDQLSVLINKDGRIRLSKNLIDEYLNYKYNLEKGLGFSIENKEINITPIN